MKAQRRKRGLLLREAALLLGVCEETVVNWERGETAPRHREGPAICEFLGFLPVKTDTFQEKLYALRFLHGWSMKDAAREAGVSEWGWTIWEAGGKPMPKKLALLQALLDRSLTPFLPKAPQPVATGVQVEALG